MQSPRKVDIEIAQVANAQHGVITRAQLTKIGVSRRIISKRTTSGRLHRVHPSVFAVGHRALSEHGHWIAAVLAAGDGAALSHISAARLWGIWRRRERAIHVVAPRYRRVSSTWQPHFSRSISTLDVTVRNQIHVTTVSRTLVDLAEMCTSTHFANAMHEAAYRNLLDSNAVLQTIERLKGRSNIRRVRDALQAHHAGSSGTRSDLEERLHQQVLTAGLPPPQVNVRIRCGHRLVECDFHWQHLDLCVEVDGPHHGRARTRLDDTARTNLLQAMGKEVVRVTLADIESGRALALVRQKLS